MAGNEPADASGRSADRVPEEAGGGSMRPFFILWSGQAVSLFATQAVQFALIWWLTLETGSATILATATLAALLPRAALGPVIGPLIDRFSRKRVMFFADGGAALAAALLAWLYLTGQVRPAHVLMLLVARALAETFHQPAMIATTSLMVPKGYLARVQGLNQALQGGLTIVAAPIGAFLVAALPMAGVMMVDVATAGFAIAPLLFIRVPRPARSGGDPAAKPSLWIDMLAGFRYLLARPGHIGILILSAVLNMCLTPAFSLLPLLVREQLGGEAVDLGWLSSIFGVGLLSGGIALGAWGGFRRRIVTSLAAIIGLGGATLLLGLAPPSPRFIAYAALLAVGFMASMANGPLQAVMQATVAPDFQGRVFTLYGSLATVTTPIGLLFAAPIAEAIGVRSWYVIGGVACLLMGGAAFFVRVILDIEQNAGPRDPVSAPSRPTESASADRSS